MAIQTELIAYRASKPLAATISRIAAERRVTKSEIIREALTLYIKAGAPEEIPQ